MEKKKKKYRRLPGNMWTRKARFISVSRATLWLAEDHLLQVDSSHFTETYKRFYLKDIQAIDIIRTAGRRNRNISFCAFVLIPVLLIAGLLLYEKEFPLSVAATIRGISFGLIAIPFLVNTLLGPTCICRLYTAVQVEELTPLGRVRTARKLIRILKPLIESEQGQIPNQNLTPELEERAFIPSEHALVQSTPEARAQETHHEKGVVHAALFAMVLLGSFLGATQLFYRTPLTTVLNLLGFLTVMVLIVFAFVRQSDGDLPSSLKKLTWSILILCISEFMFSSVYGTIYMATHGPQTQNTPPLALHVEGPIYTGYCITSSSLELILAVLGLALLRNHWKKEQNNKAAFTTQPVPETK